MMDERGQSDSRIVPTKPSNNAEAATAAERHGEGGGKAAGLGKIGREPHAPDAAPEGGMSEVLDRIREAVRRNPAEPLTALYHHVYAVTHLREALAQLARHAAPGVDHVTVEEYEKNLEANLEDLSARLRRGAYRATPVRRVMIPKPDGRERPLGIPVLEDKLVQWVTARILSTIWEETFANFSYGFRPGRSAHDALDAVTVGIEQRPINWVLDADIRAFFDTISHEWLVRFVEHRVTDRRIIALVWKWLKTGALDGDRHVPSDEGTPQGGVISPILANIYLHYVLDQWTQQWRRQHAPDEMIIVRYADDFVAGFSRRETAEQYRRELAERLAAYGLELHAEKTRTIEFGRFAAEDRKRRGERKPETFNFLGFTHICGTTRKGRYTVVRQTIRKRLVAKVKEITVELKRRRHEKIESQGRWLRAVLTGYFRYFAIPRNTRLLWAFRRTVARIWLRSLRRRSQRSRTGWEEFAPIMKQWLPSPRVCHLYPSQRLQVTTRGRSRMR